MLFSVLFCDSMNGNPWMFSVLLHGDVNGNLCCVMVIHGFSVLLHGGVNGNPCCFLFCSVTV